MKIIALGASNSRTSINAQFANTVAHKFIGADVELLDLNDFELPIFSIDREAELGHPALAQNFFDKLGSADVIVISFAEYNGSYSSAYKNLFDWTSRIDMKVFQDRPMIMLATSPGPGGAKSVLAAANGSAGYFAGDVRAAISLPSFYDNFDLSQGEITNIEVDSEINAVVTSLSAELS